MSFESTFWTSTVAQPFEPAPGAGMSGLRKPATVNFESGFAAEPVETDYALPAQVVTANGPFVVTKKIVNAGEIPAALVQLYLTDRGSTNQAQLDQSIFTAIKNAGFRMSIGSKFDPLSVQWAWRKMPAADKYTKDLYYPVVVSPKSLDGMVYSGSAVSSAELMDANFVPTAAILAKLPKQLWVYTFAVTNANNQFTDADGAQLLTVLKQAWSSALPKTGTSAYGYITLLGANPSVFGLPSGPTPGPAPTPDKNKSWLWLLAVAAAAYSQMG